MSDLRSPANRNCPRLTRFALSPTTSCPSVKHIDLSNSAGLEEVLIQANNVERIILNNCAMLRKVILQAKARRQPRRPVWAGMC